MNFAKKQSNREMSICLHTQEKTVPPEKKGDTVLFPVKNYFASRISLFSSVIRGCMSAEEAGLSRASLAVVGFPQ